MDGEAGFTSPNLDEAETNRALYDCARQVAVVRKKALIINLPCQPKAIRETLDGVFAAVPYCIDLIGGPYVETHEAVVKAFRPKSAIRKK